MRPTGFNKPYVAVKNIPFLAQASELGERLPRKGELTPGRVVWLANEVHYATGQECRAYVEDVGYIQALPNLISPMKHMPH